MCKYVDVHDVHLYEKTVLLSGRCVVCKEMKREYVSLKLSHQLYKDNCMSWT